MPERPGFYSTEVERIVEMRRREADVHRRRERELEARVTQVTQVRGDIEAKIKEYQELCGQLQRDLRKLPSAEDQAHYRTYISMQVRMAGAMNQAVVRAKSMDRTIDASKAAAEDNRRQEELERAQIAQRHVDQTVAQLWLPQADDLEELYGPDVGDVANASA